MSCFAARQLTLFCASESSSSASEVTTVWRYIYINSIIIIVCKR